MLMLRGGREVNETVCYSVDVVVSHRQFTGSPESRAAAITREVTVPIVMYMCAWPMTGRRELCAVFCRG
jgi:hypothetical protein